jgi:hypothetical protein
MTRETPEKVFRSLKGRIVEATYNEDPDLPEFAGNAVIEALPNAYNTEY